MTRAGPGCPLFSLFFVSFGYRRVGLRPKAALRRQGSRTPRSVPGFPAAREGQPCARPGTEGPFAPLSGMGRPSPTDSPANLGTLRGSERVDSPGPPPIPANAQGDRIFYRAARSILPSAASIMPLRRSWRMADSMLDSSVPESTARRCEVGTLGHGCSVRMVGCNRWASQRSAIARHDKNRRALRRDVGKMQPEPLETLDFAHCVSGDVEVVG